MSFEVKIYDKNWKPVYRTFRQNASDRQAAELYAEKVCDEIGGEHWEIVRVR